MPTKGLCQGECDLHCKELSHEEFKGYKDGLKAGNDDFCLVVMDYFVKVFSFQVARTWFMISHMVLDSL